MLCPKCGSENVIEQIVKDYQIEIDCVVDIPVIICLDCHNEITYQQRLDNVLSKFTKQKDGSYMLDKYYFDLWYRDEKFCLEDNINILKLKTVESLLNDLERSE